MSIEDRPSIPLAAGARRPVSAVVAVAMELEAQPFLEALTLLDDSDALAAPTGAQTWRLALPEGPAPEHGASSAAEPGAGEVLLVRTGIGLVAAASALAAVLTRVEPRAVIAAGTAGGLGHRVEVGDVCASATLAFTDADATVFGYARGQIPGQPRVFQADAALVESLEEVGEAALRAATPSSGSSRLHTGQMLAGNSFVTAANVADTREAFSAAISTDMESTALAQVALGAGIPFVSVRGISDLCGPEAGQDFHIAAEEAAARSAATVLALLG